MHIYYVIYRITNLINNKIYIGAHQTNNIDDDYMGSGRAICRAIKKYGIENFKKDILFVFDNKDEMYAKEKEIVTEDFCNKLDTYNIRTGGNGGFNHINKNPEERARVTLISKTKNKGMTTHIPTVEERSMTSLRNKKNYELGIGPYSQAAKEKIQSAERRLKLSKIMLTDQNAMKGSNFYTNISTNENRRFKRNEIVPNGWIKTIDYKESKMIRNWFNDGSKNYLLDKTSPKIQDLDLKRGRL